MNRKDYPNSLAWLAMRYDMKSYKMEVDDSKITYPSHLSEDIRALKEELASEAMKPMMVKRLEQNNRTAYATNLDRTGTRLELIEADKRPVHCQRRMEK